MAILWKALDSFGGYTQGGNLTHMGLLELSYMGSCGGRGAQGRGWLSKSGVGTSGVGRETRKDSQIAADAILIHHTGLGDMLVIQ